MCTESKPRDKLQWDTGEEEMGVIPPRGKTNAEQAPTVEERLELFDQATRRQKVRERRGGKASAGPPAHGWKRDDVYERDIAD